MTSAHVFQLTPVPPPLPSQAHLTTMRVLGLALLVCVASAADLRGGARRTETVAVVEALAAKYAVPCFPQQTNLLVTLKGITSKNTERMQDVRQGCNEKRLVVHGEADGTIATALGKYTAAQANHTGKVRDRGDLYVPPRVSGVSSKLASRPDSPRNSVFPHTRTAARALFPLRVAH